MKSETKNLILKPLKYFKLDNSYNCPRKKFSKHDFFNLRGQYIAKKNFNFIFKIFEILVIEIQNDSLGS